uniref:Chromosome LG6 open reading frame, human C15orf40 n=1 Tax=Poecilia reticulata TaxID=8081 RepID=A0A3P9Q714_POERE
MEIDVLETLKPVSRTISVQTEIDVLETSNRLKPVHQTIHLETVGKEEDSEPNSEVQKVSVLETVGVQTVTIKDESNAKETVIAAVQQITEEEAGSVNQPDGDQLDKKKPSRKTPDSGPVTRDKTGSVSITVHAKPGSKHSSITDVSSQAVGVSIAAPPTDGEANTELVRYLAEVLELKKSQISLDKGSRSRDKVIKVDSSLDPEEVLKRLRQAAS